ncbi:MAG TPA: hypothetical protein VGO62_18640 [Myxococcota bacterium]|jgi:hypothetical protein
MILRSCALGLVLAFASACPGAAGADAGVVDLPDSGCSPAPSDCVQPAPVYADVSSIFSTECTSCHGPGGVEASIPLDTHDHVQAHAGIANNELVNCLMPLLDAGVVIPPLAAPDRDALLHYFACGALP